MEPHRQFTTEEDKSTAAGKKAKQRQKAKKTKTSRNNPLPPRDISAVPLPKPS